MVQSLDDARRRNQSANRVPPHNLQAEQSLLGAMLLSRDAIASAVETCSADDFYKPAHGHVFDAIATLYSQGEPADPLTVADVLGRANLLDAIGGLPALVSLQADTPATANAARYARIVEEHALLRRLIAVAGEIAELGYGVPDDVLATVDRAESLVFEIAERRVTDSLKPLRVLLEDSLDRLSALYSKGESITGVPTGFVDLDERLSGLQKSALIIVGARPAMGKCVAWDTRIVDPDTGAVATIEDLYRRHAHCRHNVGLLSLGGDQRLSRRRVDAWVDDGTKPVFRVRTRLGREVRTTASHPFLTPSGWRPLHQLAVGGRVAVPRELAVFGGERQPAAEVTRMADAVVTGVATPPAVWRLPRVQLAAFVHRLWTTAGTGDGRTVLRNRSLRLAHDVQHLLLRFGINARLCLRSAADGDTHGPTWELEVLGGEDVRRFRASIATAGSPVIDTSGVPAPAVSVPPPTPTGAAELTRTPGVARPVLVAAGGGPSMVPAGVGTVRDAAGQGPERPAVADDAGVGPQPGSDIYWDEIVSVTADGEDRVYDLTVARTHNFVADDMLVHNTAFALGIAAHAAMKAKVPTLIFSLEMSHSELTQRLLVSEARVDANRIRNGKLLESDWPKISNAIGRLGEAPLFIDDNPNLTVMEVRAKARRMKAKEGGLGLIIIDYLQLMSGRSSAENRQVEVSEISRGLKILARELEVPVVALSQLSRQLESRADKRPMLADLRESGCMPADTRLLRADDGQEITLGELVAGHHRPLVWSLDDRTGRLVPGRLLRAFASGIKEVFRLRLASGREVKASANHPFRTVDGWVRLDHLRAGDALAVPGTVPAPVGGATPMRDHQLALVGAGAGPALDAAANGARTMVSATVAPADAEVAWDEVIDITSCGMAPTFDATVEGTHNFVADGIIAHNSLEQDADVVMFLYRDEIYDPESADRGTAEVIVSKHRNGPTGKTSLAFLDHHTRFEDMARL
jgi:replicative DNA helicase